VNRRAPRITRRWRLIGRESLDLLRRYNIATKGDLEKAIAKRGALDERESAG